MAGKKGLFLLLLNLVLAACASPQSCATEPYYVHRDSEAELKLPGDTRDAPLSSVHLGAGCDQKSFIVRKTIIFSE